MAIETQEITTQSEDVLTTQGGDILITSQGVDTDPVVWTPYNKLDLDLFYDNEDDEYDSSSDTYDGNSFTTWTSQN